MQGNLDLRLGQPIPSASRESATLLVMNTSEHTGEGARRLLTWVPRKYGSRLGFVVSGSDVVACDISRRDAEGVFGFVGYDRDGMSRRDADGRTLADRIAALLG